jgi:hypothetical protein
LLRVPAAALWEDHVVIINGYLDGFGPAFESSPLFDGHDLIADPLFWPAFFCTVGLYETSPAAFAVDRADLEPLFDVLTDSRRMACLQPPAQSSVS